MPPEVCERLFSARAVTTKRGGTGLGTKIVKDVVDAHQAQITVSSEIGRGTTFRFGFLSIQRGCASHVYRKSHAGMIPSAADPMPGCGVHVKRAG